MTYTLCNFVCYDCSIDKIYNIGKMDKPNMEVLNEVGMQMMKCGTHNGFSVTYRISTPDAVEKFLKDLNGERTEKILKVAVTK